MAGAEALVGTAAGGHADEDEYVATPGCHRQVSRQNPSARWAGTNAVDVAKPATGPTSAPTKPKNRAAHIAQAKEDEPTLLMTRLSSIQIHSKLVDNLMPAAGSAPHYGSPLHREAATEEPAVGSVAHEEAPPLREQVSAGPEVRREQVPVGRGACSGAPLHREAATETLAAGPEARWTPIHLKEARAFAQIDDEGDADDTLWYLDTGATNHMSGSCVVFSDIDNNIYGTMRFGDGSVVNIEGRGTVLFACKNGEHRQLTDMYLIPRLNTNLISVGQTDEDGYDIHIEHGVMRIRDEQRRLLAQVARSSNRLYTIKLHIARPVCLTARRVDEAWHWHNDLATSASKH